MSVTHVDLEATPLDGLTALLDPDYNSRFTARMEDAAKQLEGRTVWNINSTAEGGGVAEMLATLLPYCLSFGWDIRWAVMFGDEAFFDVTKNLHNALHGAPLNNGGLGKEAADVYSSITRANAEELLEVIAPGDIVLVHDPQAAGLIAPLTEKGARVSWQCHIGTDDANENTRTAWDFLRSYVEKADRYVFTREAYLWEGLRRDCLRIIPPSIDALSGKNMELDDDQVISILQAAGVLEGDVEASYTLQDGDTGTIRHRVERVGGAASLGADARIVLQVSRWDRLKDPVGCIRMFTEHLGDLENVHLIHAGPSAAEVDDDPEGAEVLAECAEVWKELPAELQRRVHLLSVPMDDVEENAVIINALQRYSDVVMQKSLQEGFGLTVSEAMWKRKAVLASRVGGIQDQIEDGKSGILVNDPTDIAGFAREARDILGDRSLADRLGVEAQRRVCEHFLGPRQLWQYADLICELVEERAT